MENNRFLFRHDKETGREPLMAKEYNELLRAVVFAEFGTGVGTFSVCAQRNSICCHLNCLMLGQFA